MYKHLEDHVKDLHQLAHDYELVKPLKDCEELLSDISQDNYSFVVVGEFSTGKSTFINGFIGNDILPTGITPTTSTINVLRYGDPKAIIHYLEDSYEHEISIQDLKNYVASNTEDIETINYIEVFQKNDFLQDNITLIDTPGLNDVNKLRSDITYLYIPRADVIFFLLDCRTPLRKSEFDFLTETLIAHNLERIIFIANFADEIEEEELDFTLSRIEMKLKESLKIPEIIVIPYCATEVIYAKQHNDEALLEISGYNILQQHVQNLCDQGIRQQEKLNRFEQRSAVIEEEIKLALNQKQQLNNRSVEELNQELKKIDNWRNAQEQILQAINQYYEERLFDFEKMVEKSVKTFFNQLQEDIIEDIRLFHGNSYQHYFHEVLPAKIKKQMKLWIEKYSPQIQILISKLEISLNELLSDYLKENVYLKHTYTNDLQKSSDIHLDIQKQTDPMIASGLIVGGASTLFLLIGGPILLPILGMVGLPFIQKKLLENQLEKIKPQVISDLEIKLLIVQQDFEEEVIHYLRSNCEKVYLECIKAYEERVNQQFNLVNARLEELQSNANQNEQENIVIQQKLSNLLKIEA